MVICWRDRVEVAALTYAIAGIWVNAVCPDKLSLAVNPFLWDEPPTLGTLHERQLWMKPIRAESAVPC